MSREPAVELNVRGLVCRKHESALAADPAVNSIAFPLQVFQAAAADPRAQAACRAGQPGDVERLAAFLRTVEPVCEWITADALEAAWAEARRLGRGARA